MVGGTWPWTLQRPSSLQRIDTLVPDVFALWPKVLRDRRGFFTETYHQAEFATLGITDQFVQDSHSCSCKGTLRGLHYQLRHPQAKLCRVVEGEALDVAVDIRVGSPHFGKWVSAVLSAKDLNQIYIPAGFAHGFLALSDTVHFLYKCSDFYDVEDQHGIAWDDPGLAIVWDISNPLISEKDKELPTLSSLPLESLPRYLRT
jgi:dTDP-4-dehydrorhamnose 3,5-epimerase